MRQGVVITFLDGRTITEPGIISDSTSRLRRLRRLYGAQVEWGPVVKRPRKQRGKDRRKGAA